MVRLFALLLLTTSLSVAYAQKKEGNFVVIQEVVLDSLGANGEKLHSKIEVWFGKYFRNAKEVITANNKELVAGRYLVGVKQGPATVDFYHSITIDIKDGRVRVKIVAESTTAGYPSASYFYNNKGELRTSAQYERWMDNLLADSTALLSSLEKDLRGGGEDW